MRTAVTHFLSVKLRSDPPLSSQQQKNVDTLVGISDIFHADAGIPQGQKIPVSEELLVLESGHQPNFLPYPGVWKKVFLLHRIVRQLKSRDREAIAFFGFADQNLSTARLLYENKVPAVNKQGRKKFGFKIKEPEKWKRFNTLNKPAKDDWDLELDKLRDHYLPYLPRNHEDAQVILRNIDTLTDIMERCYSRATNLADVNAFIFARTCQELFDIPVHFFRYSDVQHANLFINEWKRIIGSLQMYTREYNHAIHEKKLLLVPVPPDFFPFWYHCPCGAKVALSINIPGGCHGICPVCKTAFSFPVFSDIRCLADLMKDMGMSAVTRNIIFSEGLGTRLFISGSGGGLRYGQVANTLSERLSFNIPLTLSWQSRDYYIGITHMAALKDMLRFFNLTFNDLVNGLPDEKIGNYRMFLLQQAENLKQDSEQKKESIKYSGLYRSSATQVSITKKTFSTIPSIIDLLVNFNAPFLVGQWDDALGCAEIKDSEDTVVIKQDISYCQGNTGKFTFHDIPRIYHSLEVINEP